LIMVLLSWNFIYKRMRAIRKKHDVEKKVLAIEKQLYDTELQTLRLQMNPHFIFNTLNSIQSYILSSDSYNAVEYLGKFSQLMRLILTNSREPFISLAEEVKALTYYLDIEKLRFDNKFEYSFVIDPAIDEEFMEIPPMLVQPYVENAIIHGLIHKEGKGNININLKLDGDLIVWAIEDNGIGREKAMQIKRDSGLQQKSRGMLITMERLKVLNKKNEQIFRVNVIDLKEEKGLPTGTRVELRISYRES
ncbi:MAG: histidine kinase, partial [Bacteroidales bacterium]|nr:histidine kinase [Bacteroidales bacterium]